MTKGEYRVGITFNPSNDDVVAKIKRQAADLIDLIEGIDPQVQDAGSSVAAISRMAEVLRLQALAHTAIEEGAMWAVRAATKPAPQVEG